MLESPLLRAALLEGGLVIVAPRGTARGCLLLRSRVVSSLSLSAALPEVLELRPFGAFHANLQNGRVRGNRV